MAGWGCYVCSLRLIGEEAGVVNRTAPRHGGSAVEAVMESTVGTPEEAGVGTNDEAVDELRLHPQSAPEKGGDSPAPVPSIPPGF